MTWGIALSYLAVWVIASIPAAIAIGCLIARGNALRPPKRRDGHSTRWLTTLDLWLAVGLVLACSAMAEGSI